MQTNLSHLLPVFGSKLITDIDAKDVADYQKKRQLKKADGAKGASPKTVNLEIGTLRVILRRYRVWALIRPDVKMLAVTGGVGRAITPDEEAALLSACAASRSRSLPVAVTIALNTCMRLSEVRLLRWNQADFVAETITVGKSKTAAGTGRVIPMTASLVKCLEAWAANFPDRKPSEYVFPFERYVASGDDFVPCVYDTVRIEAIRCFRCRPCEGGPRSSHSLTGRRSNRTKKLPRLARNSGKLDGQRRVSGQLQTGESG